MHVIVLYEEVSTIRNITLRVSDDFHYSVKTFSARQGTSLQNYMIDTVERDLKSKNAFVKFPDALAEMLDDLSEEEMLEVLRRVREEKKKRKE